MKIFLLYIILWVLSLESVLANDTVVIGDTMYQNQAFTAKDKYIFDTDWEGLRVWRWSKAQDYCKKLKLDDYDGWRVANKRELERIMTSSPSKGGLYIKSVFSKKMPSLGGKYDDVWMWTREGREGGIGAFVNLKKRKTGWADKKYKGYVICTRSIGKDFKSNTTIKKLKKPLLFEYKKNIWRSDMTQKGTKPLGNYSLLYFYCQNGLSPSIPHASRLVKHKKTTYFFAYRGNDKKDLNLYRTNGRARGAKKIGSIGDNVAFSLVWVGDRLYFLSSAYLPQQADPPEEKLWMLDTRADRLRYIGETIKNNSNDILYPFAQSKRKLFFQRWSAGKGDIAGVWFVDQKEGFKKVKGFKKVPDHLESIKVAGESCRLSPLKTLPWGCGSESIQGSFKIEKRSISYKKRQILKLSNIKDLHVHNVELVFNGEEYAILASANHLWGITSRGEMKRLR